MGRPDNLNKSLELLFAAYRQLVEAVGSLLQELETSNGVRRFLKKRDIKDKSKAIILGYGLVVSHLRLKNSDAQSGYAFDDLCGAH